MSYIRTPETREKIRRALIGRKHTEEQKQKIRASVHRAYATEQVMAKFKNRKAWNAGVPMRPETKTKLSAFFKGRSNVALIGRKHSEETKRKCGLANRGKRPTEETNKKRSESMKRRLADPVNRAAFAATRPRGPAHHNYGKPAYKGSGIGKGSYCAKGHWVRSSWERGIADWLFKQNIAYEYESELFDFGDGLRYRPDFYLPEFDRWYECKGYMTERDRQKIAAFRATGRSLFVIDRPWWKRYTNGRDDLPREYMIAA